MNYALTLTEDQARTVGAACETLARLGMGQFEDALRYLPLREEVDWSQWNDDVRTIAGILSRHMRDGLDGHQRSLGIQAAAPRAQLAWDIHQVIRHRLAWDRATREGITDGRQRQWPQMMEVEFDPPTRIANAPLPVVEAAASPTPTEPFELLAVCKQLLDWNRAQAHPPIQVGQEYGVAEQLLALLSRRGSDVAPLAVHA